MAQTAGTLLSEAKTERTATEAAVGARCLGFTCLFQGNFAEGRANLDEALRIYDPKRDRETKVYFSDTGAVATAYLARTKNRAGFNASLPLPAGSLRR